MKKVLALLLALMLTLSLAACGGSGDTSEGKDSKGEEKKRVITVSQLNDELKGSFNSQSGFSLTKNGDVYSWSGKILMDSDTADIEVKADEEDHVISVSIMDKGIYNEALDSWSSISELMEQINSNSGECTFGELAAATCISQAVSLISAACDGDSSVKAGELLKEAFSSGKCEINGWKISVGGESTRKVQGDKKGKEGKDFPLPSVYQVFCSGKDDQNHTCDQHYCAEDQLDQPYALCIVLIPAPCSAVGFKAVYQVISLFEEDEVTEYQKRSAEHYRDDFDNCHASTCNL